MPAAVPTGPQTITAEDDQVSPAALHRPERQPDLDHVSTRGGVANNGRHPAPSKHAGQHVDITPLTMSAQDTDAQPSSPIHVASDNARSDQQMPAEVNTDRTVSIDQQEVEKPAVTPSLEANLQTNASDRSDAVAGLPDSILQQESSISLPKQTAAQVPPSADTAQAPEPLQSPFSTLTQPAQVTSSDNSAVPTTEGEASTSDLQHSADASVTGSQLTQREGSQAQAAAVADAIKKAAQLSLPAPAPGETYANLASARYWLLCCFSCCSGFRQVCQPTAKLLLICLGCKHKKEKVTLVGCDFANTPTLLVQTLLWTLLALAEKPC